VRVVVDSGVLISALIQPQGTTGGVLRALREGRFVAIFSTDMVVEVVEVLGRPFFCIKYHIEPDDITALIHLVRLRGELVVPVLKVAVCRDPKDDKFLEAALAGKADCVISGDADLIVLSPFEDIPILRPAEFLARL
jgi:putative PIN family toxin of toxin-antitoxin system